MSGVPSTSDVVAAEITQDAAARDNRTACKRKLQRIEGSLAVLDELISSGNDKGIGTNLPVVGAVRIDLNIAINKVSAEQAAEADVVIGLPSDLIKAR